MTGLTRAAAARIIAGYFGTDACHVGGGYDAYTVRDTTGRQWKVMSDASIRRENGNGRSAGSQYSVEVVSPICQYGDIETMASKEDLLYKALQVRVSREHYCMKADTRFLDDLNQRKPATMREVERLWYNGYGGRQYHYDDSRYHGLNLHSVFSKGTIEFRMFNSTLHAGEIKSYIQLCLAISHQALVQKSASRTKTHPENEKYTFRTWLLRLGLIGDEFKTARQHLLKNLEGNIAWRDPAQAEAQKERLAAKRLAEQQAEEETETAQTESAEDMTGQEQNAPAFSMSM